MKFEERYEKMQKEVDDIFSIYPGTDELIKVKLVSLCHTWYLEGRREGFDTGMELKNEI